MKLSRLVLTTFACVLIGGVALTAQGLHVAARITAPVDESILTPLKGNVTPRAAAQFDRGEVAPATQLTHVRLVLKRSSVQESALQQLLVQQREPSSPQYQRWLTPDQFGALYGPADADIAAITAWLESHGLKVESVSKGRTNIAFSGSVRQVEEALHTQIHSFMADGESFYSNVSDPQIPSALSVVISGIAHLNTLRPRPHLKRGPTTRFEGKASQSSAPNKSKGLRPQPHLTLSGQTTASGYFLFLTPQDAATIYNTPNSQLNVNYSSGQTYDGTGVNIGVGGDALIQLSTVANFRQQFLPSQYSANLPIIVNVDGVTSTTNPADRDEAYLDVELAGGAAPGATIYFYTSTDLATGIEQALTDNVVDLFSLSFGQCERFLSTSDNSLISAWWQQAQSQGIVVMVSSGDNGSAGCDDPNSVTVAQYGLGVSGFASTPYNIAVGGTDFGVLNGQFLNYVNSTDASYRGSAKGYIPESVWNDSSYADTTIADNVPWTAVSGGSANAGIWAGSGGASTCSTNSTSYGGGGSITLGSCTGGYAKPTWQTGAGVPNDQVRDVPDVSLMSGSGLDSAVWTACTDDAVSGTSFFNNCAAINAQGDFYLTGFGGTSAATPTFAGILALVQQKTGTRLGQAAAVLYQLASSTHGNVVFHDIIDGNNSVPCDLALTVDGSCALNTAGYHFETGYDAQPTYDLATGLGSVDAKELINAWGSVSGARYYTLSAQPATVATPGGTGSSLLALTAFGGYTGTVTVRCAVTDAPANAVDLPTCSAAGLVALSVATPSATVLLTVNTTAQVASLNQPNQNGKPFGTGWKRGGGVLALAFVLFVGVPRRRRNWLAMASSLLLLMVGLGSVVGCGGGGKVVPLPNPGTTPGVYEVTVTATGSDSAATRETTTFLVTVN